ncbi:MAG: S8 family serine peptidase, partial [Candidatus Krumholzibacteria bacterium]|nr:S8 family serine peptidase [Candidatus Krumholzibacteria bacterium]
MGFNGSGVKIAIVDLGFIGLSDAIAAGEIPPTAHRLKGNQTGIDIEVDTKHGTGVAEHAIDMAPGAELYCIYVEDEVDLENAADYMRDNGIHVANHSVGWVNASYYDDTGPLTGIINNSHDSDGVFWAVSAGNGANRHWRGTWSDPDGDSRLNWTGSPDEYHDLSGSYSTAYIFLNWDQYGNSLTDLDLYIYDKNTDLVASSTGSQTGPEDPQEWVSFSYDTGLAPYRIVVEHHSGPTGDLDMTIFSFYHDLEYAIPDNAFMEPADAHGAFTVGAIYQGNYNLPDPPPEPFSSHGPTNDGRMKPEITAPDGTQSYTYGASYGTSFSSPTTAGAAAVMLTVDPTFTPAQIGDSLMAMAIDIGIAGQ